MYQPLQLIFQRADIADDAIRRHAARQTFKPIAQSDMIGRTLIEQAADIIANLRTSLWLLRWGLDEETQIVGKLVRRHRGDG